MLKPIQQQSGNPSKRKNSALCCSWETIQQLRAVWFSARNERRRSGGVACWEKFTQVFSDAALVKWADQVHIRVLGLNLPRCELEDWKRTWAATDDVSQVHEHGSTDKLGYWEMALDYTSLICHCCRQHVQRNNNFTTQLSLLRNSFGLMIPMGDYFLFFFVFFLLNCIQKTLVH